MAKDSLSLSYISNEIRKLMEKEYRKDPGHRLLLTHSQLGSLDKYITHDPATNPSARPYGSPEDEELALGQAFVQLVGYAQSREINIEKAIYKGLKNWEEQDWRKSEAKSHGNVIKGILACEGYVTGNAFLDQDCKNLDKLDGQILVTRSATPEIASYFSKATGIVTDNGGKTCHAAAIARDYKLPCVVGTGNATQRISNGRKIKIKPGRKRDEGLVYLL